MDPLTILAIVTTGASFISSIIGGRKQKEEDSRARADATRDNLRIGRDISGQHLSRVGDIARDATWAIDDIRRGGQEVIGMAHAGYAAGGGRVRGGVSRVDTSEVLLGHENLEVQAVDANEMASEVERDDYATRDEYEAEKERLAAQAEADQKREMADELRELDIQEWQHAVNQKMQETGGSLMRVQLSSLHVIERDLERTITAARSSMADEYMAAATAHEGGQAPPPVSGPGFWDYLAGGLDTASSLFQLGYSMQAGATPRADT